MGLAWHIKESNVSYDSIFSISFYLTIEKFGDEFAL